MLLMGKSTISMAIFNSYISLPEGIQAIKNSLNSPSGANENRFDTWPHDITANDCHYLDFR